jgi:hypothetical protein
MAELAEEATTEVVIVKVVLVAAAGTTTVPGTCATDEFELVKVIVAPPLRAGPLRVTVALAIFPPGTLAGVKVKELTVGDP